MTFKGRDPIRTKIIVDNEIIVQVNLFNYLGNMMQWVQNPSQSNVDNLNSVRREVSRHFRNKKKAYLRAKIEELETNSKIKNIRDFYRGINDFKKGFQPRCHIVMHEKADLFADSRGNAARWMNHFSQLFNVHGFKDVGQV